MFKNGREHRTVSIERDDGTPLTLKLTAIWYGEGSGDGAYEEFKGEGWEGLSDEERETVIHEFTHGGEAP